MLSVIVCTRNRAQSLRLTLRSLSELFIPTGLQLELIVVDNNSNDETSEVVKEFMQTAPFAVRHVFEIQNGLCRARNRGLSEAMGEIIAFTDDDCLAAPTWVETISQEFAGDPELAGLGGSFFNYNKDDRAMRTRVFKERTLFSAPKHAFKLIAGGNMAFRRGVFDQIGQFDSELDAGTKFKSAGDSDFVYRAFKAGCKIVHSPKVIVHHNHGRRTDAQIQSLMQGYLIGRGAFYAKHILQGDRDILNLAYRELSKRTKRLIKSLFKGESIKQQAHAIGALIKGGVYKMAAALFSQRHGNSQKNFFA